MENPPQRTKFARIAEDTRRGGTCTLRFNAGTVAGGAFKGDVDPHAVGERRQMEVHSMAAMKPRTGDGPMEATKEGRHIVMRIPSEGGGRLVIELTPEEAVTLAEELTSATA